MLLFRPSQIFTSTVYSTEELCAFDDFVCDDRKCISGQLVCDGHSDCQDSSDENRCGELTYSRFSPTYNAVSQINIKLCTTKPYGEMTHSVFVMTTMMSPKST